VSTMVGEAEGGPARPVSCQVDSILDRIPVPSRALLMTSGGLDSDRLTTLIKPTQTIPATVNATNEMRIFFPRWLESYQVVDATSLTVAFQPAIKTRAPPGVPEAVKWRWSLDFESDASRRWPALPHPVHG
jgi:hypothetical protein